MVVADIKIQKGRGVGKQRCAINWQSNHVSFSLTAEGRLRSFGPRSRCSSCVVEVAIVVSSCFAERFERNERYGPVSFFFVRLGEHWLRRAACITEGEPCFRFLLPSLLSCSLIASLLLLRLGFVTRLAQSFILYHKLSFFYTHAHTSKRLLPLSPILFMDHCARTHWHMYIHEVFFFPLPLLCVRVCMCVCYKEAGRFLLLGWPVQEVLVPFSLSLSLSLVCLSRFGCVETGSLYSQFWPSRPNQKKKKNCRIFFLFLTSS